MTRNNSEGRLIILQRRIGAYGRIQPEMSLSGGGIRTVAFEAFVGKDRADLPVVADTVGCGSAGVAVQARGKKEYPSRDEGQYGSNAVDAGRFALKINQFYRFSFFKEGF